MKIPINKRMFECINDIYVIDKENAPFLLSEKS